MTTRESVALYIYRVRSRLRLQALLRGLALTLLCALALTLIAVPAAHSYRFTESAVRWARLLLMGGTAAALALLVIAPLLRRWNDAQIARFIEEHHPEFRDRLATAVEYAGAGAADSRAPASGAPAGRKFDPEMIDLLLEDAHRSLSGVPAETYVDSGRLRRFSALAAGSLGLLLVLAFFGPSVYRFGTRHLWAGWLHTGRGPLYQVAVTPGDARVPRRSDQVIAARPSGFQPRAARLFVYYQSGTRWEELPMQPEERANEFRRLLTDVRENVRYWVEAGGVRSPEFQLTVAELPRVQRIEVTYRYPSYTGLPAHTEPDAGDIRAVKGTAVDVVVHTDLEAESGDLLLDSGKSIELRRSGERQLRGTLTVEDSGLYHVRLARRGERGGPARASDDYVIEALPDQPPIVALRRPGRDAHPTSIEEVTAQVEAQDDFGVSELRLRYSVNGGPERDVDLLQRRGAKQADGRYTFFLEDYKLVPGDLVAYYADARDARQAVQTDMYFMEVRPFEREYRQSQAAGGMGQGQGEGDDNSNLAARQKEIIAATWNLLRDRNGPGDDAKVLSGIQKRLKEQTETLATRLERRELAGLNREFTSLVENLRKAAEAMGPAAEQLGARKLKEALPPEQKALQHLSRAEALFKEIQVAFGNSQGGSRGRSGGSARDLADLFDMELDTQKNQYETLQQRRDSQRDAKLDEALKRLQELARRQQQLADQRRREQQQQPAASRWEQEMLRRQTEELARELAELSRQTGSRDSGSREMDTIRQRLEQAARDMRNQQAQSGQSGQSGSQRDRQAQAAGEEAARERALERLQEARDLLARRRGEQNRQAIDRLGEEAQELVRDQQQVAETVRRFPGPESDKRAEAFGRAMEQKSKVFEGLNDLERQLHKAARQLAATQPEVSRKLRGAGNRIREEELQEKVRQGAEMLRRGLNQLAQQREEGLRRALEQLEQQIGEARRNFNAQAGGQNPADSRMERALARAEDLRRRLEELEERLRQAREQNQRSDSQGNQGQATQQPGRAGQQAQGREPGSGQPDSGQQGQAGSNAGAASGDRQAGSRAAARGNRGGMPDGAFNRGVDRPFSGAGREPRPLTPEQRRELEREYREGLPLALELQKELRGDPDFARRARELVESMRNLEAGRFPGDPAELERLRASIVDGLRQVELELSRRLGAGRGELRLPAHEEIPDSYRRQVEQYYRSLAQRPRR